MKSDFHFHFYSRIFIMLILAVSLLLIQQSVRSKAQITAYPYEVTGWAWNNTALWFSLNCYNDFEVPGEYLSTCATVDYGLQIAEGGNISGCIWAGNNVGGSGSALGWVCFNDFFSGFRATPSGLGVATSSQYLNAIAPTTFASIISFEDWRCVGGTNDGQRCAPTTNFCSTTGGVCTFTNDEKWKLGFPIIDTGAGGVWNADLPSPTNPIQGCFNCYQEYTYVCSIDGLSCDPSLGCESAGTPPTPQDCVVSTVTNRCDNCLEYSYYPGWCEAADGSRSATMGCADFTDSTADCCASNDDCASGETCHPVSSCVAWTINGREEYACPAAVCSSIPGGCVPRTLGTYRMTVGGYDCSGCSIESYDNRCPLNATGANLNSCESCTSTFYYPGVMIDNKHYNLDSANGEKAYMCGWAWNAWDDNADGIADNGLYWFNFSPRIATSTRPYLSVESGNIYSQKGVSGDYLPPFGHYNSSYLIESGGSISNFITSSTLSGLYQGEIPYQPIISFLRPDAAASRYSNALGSIDYLGLVTDVDPTAGSINKYGSNLLTPALINNTLFVADALLSESKVYYYNGDLTINTAGGATHTLIAGTGTQNAARTVVVEGDLLLGDNFNYQTVGVNYTNFRNIPSIVWIVRGDLFVDPDVSQLVGTFVVLGDGASPDCSYVSPAVPTLGCGQMVTCNDTNGPALPNCQDLPLVVRGSVMAKYFNLGRGFVDIVNAQPSEQFISDGRLQVNPPAGFDDLSSIIPRFSEN